MADQLPDANCVCACVHTCACVYAPCRSGVYDDNKLCPGGTHISTRTHSSLLAYPTAHSVGEDFEARKTAIVVKVISLTGQGIGTLGGLDSLGEESLVGCGGREGGSEGGR